MVTYLALFLLLFSASFSWAQPHPQTHQHLKEILDYENNLEDSYPIFLAIPKGLDEEQPLHFYQQSEDAIARLSTYYFTEEDSLVTKALHQWSHFNDMFQPNKPFHKELIGDLKSKYIDLRLELAQYFGTDTYEYEDENPTSLIYGEVTKWKTPLLYDPMLEYKELIREENAYGVITLAYVHQGWEQMVLKQLEFLQYYFISKVKENDYTTAMSFLSSDLQKEVNQEHIKELHKVLSEYELVLVNTKEGFFNLEREYLFMYNLQDKEGETHYTMTIAFNNNQDIIFLQYNFL